MLIEDLIFEIRPKKDGLKHINNYIVDEISENWYGSRGINDEDYDSLITDSDIEDVYFMHHKEMRWNSFVECKSNDTFKDKVSCGNQFYLSEKDIFHLDGHFYQMCPMCGCITDVSNKIEMEEVKKRIIEKSDKDDNLSRKSSILSELYSLDTNYRSLVKKRGN